VSNTRGRPQRTPKSDRAKKLLETINSTWGGMVAAAEHIGVAHRTLWRYVHEKDYVPTADVAKKIGRRLTTETPSAAS